MCRGAIGSGRRQTVDSISEAVFLCEFESDWVDIDRADF